MTEYEIADLAASKAFQLQGGVSLFQTGISMMTDIIQQYMIILFAYMIAAYFIGANLSRRQVWVLTTLYVMFQIWWIVAFVGRGYMVGKIMEGIIELQDYSGALERLPLALRTTSPVLLVAALFASLYFMWSVRHPKTE
jgi:hypothetical protein